MSNKARLVLGLVTGILASLLCLCGGIYLLLKNEDHNPIQTGLGLYFIGKAFFVGPMLILTAARPADGPAA